MPFKQTIGSRTQVMNGTARKTSGGLHKKHLKYNPSGRIVSKKASALAKSNNRLIKAGYVTTKGVFGCKLMKGGGINIKTLPYGEPINNSRISDNKVLLTSNKTNTKSINCKCITNSNFRGIIYDNNQIILLHMDNSFFNCLPNPLFNGRYATDIQILTKYMDEAGQTIIDKNIQIFPTTIVRYGYTDKRIPYDTLNNLMKELEKILQKKQFNNNITKNTV